jgi:polyhydroxybutyrate depolymerase
MPNAIFASGFWNGGMMAYRLGCELSDRIAAIGVVSGVLVYERCASGRPVTLLHIHGTNDHVVPYAGQTSPDGLPSVAKSIERWRALSPGVDVQLVTIDGGGHVWPRDIGGAPSTSGIRASDARWSFFTSHRR